MKRIIVIAFALATIACSRIPSDVEARITGIVENPGHPWRQWLEDVDALMVEIKKLPDSQLKIKCLRHFADRLIEIDLLDPSICSMQVAVGGVVDECACRIPGMMHLSGASIEDVWDERLKIFAWMQTQSRRLYGDGELPKGLTRDKNGNLVISDQDVYRRWVDRRNAYRTLTSAYIERLNYSEKHFPNSADGWIDERRIPALKQKIEKFLGRPMRTPAQCAEDWYSNKREFPKW